MDSKLIIGAAAVTLVGVWLFRRKNEQRVETRQQNQQTENLTDAPTSQAVRLKQALQWEKGLLSWSGQRITDNYPSRQAALFDVCLEITNWKAVQNKFSALCNNESTLLEAFQACLDNDSFNIAQQLCAANKVVTTSVASAAIYKDGEGEPTRVDFAANTVVGAYVATYNETVSFINGFQSDGGWFWPELEKYTGTIAANVVKIVNPNS